MLRNLIGFFILALFSFSISASGLYGLHLKYGHLILNLILFILAVAFIVSWKKQRQKDLDFVSMILILGTVASLRTFSHEVNKTKSKDKIMVHTSQVAKE